MITKENATKKASTHEQHTFDMPILGLWRAFLSDRATDEGVYTQKLGSRGIGALGKF